MKTFINRSDLYRFERLVSKLVKPAELPATISFAPCSHGLQAVKTKVVANATVAARRVRPIGKPSNSTNEQMDVIAASEGLCQTLADTLRITRRLVQNLKHQRKQNRLMRATIASLKQLQNV